MPKRTDIKKIMMIGSGPIIIGQGCEFDYAGTQACKALREEGYEVVLVNSNPATIMTDPGFANRTYVEPLVHDILQEIIRRERPDALLPTLGGQTALNLAMELCQRGTLQHYLVEMIGANAEVIMKAEDRLLFKQTLLKIGLDVPRSAVARTMEEAHMARAQLGPFPLVIRPSFTLGGTGGGIAYDEDDFIKLAHSGLFYSPTSEVLIEESVIGWKEFEMEVMRDQNDNCVIVCAIENIDPMGVHTGDSITVAPAQTLTDREYQSMRDAAIAVMREIGVNTGGANVQFAINPANGRMVVIEMNPRVSRSSALASKATGFPIAKIAAKLAVGYTLNEIRNDITRQTPACFEPALDYVVTKIPRFAFEKFPGADTTLGTQMKSVGETMSIGRTFKQSLQKALRSLETGRAGFGADGRDGHLEHLSDDDLARLLRTPHAARLFAVRVACQRGWSIARIAALTLIDPWFLRHMAELTSYEDEIRQLGSLEQLLANQALLRQAKEFGYADRQIAFLLHTTEEQVRLGREQCGIKPAFAAVDTCAAEFVAFTPYFYSTYDRHDLTVPDHTRQKIMILGGGPNRIGQGIEFDYCCVHASFALRAAGFATVMVNCNPETVSTDYDTSDRLYFEPLTVEDVLNVYRHEQCCGAIVQFGGQTPLELALELARNGMRILGTSPESIEMSEDRQACNALIGRLGIPQPAGSTATSVEQAEAIAAKIGYPVLMRPSFVLGGRAMAIIYDQTMLRRYMAETGGEISTSRPVLVDQYLAHAREVDVDCVADGATAVIGAIMEHVELAGIHSGDSACLIPATTLSEASKAAIRQYTHALAKALDVRGLMNVQYAVKDEKVYLLEVNPRASRTVPFVSKTIGVPLAKLAALAMVGFKLAELGFTREIIPRHHAAKEAVFPFSRFTSTDVVLSPEMKSTGEVMGIDTTVGMAFLKSQIAAGNSLPVAGNIFLSVRDDDKQDVIPLARELVELGYAIYATKGTSTILRENGIRSHAVFRVSNGRPNVIDLIEEKSIGWIINTPSPGPDPQMDEIRMRTHAVIRRVPITTTIDGLRAAINGLKSLQKAHRMEICSLQEYHRHAPVLALPNQKEQA